MLCPFAGDTFENGPFFRKAPGSFADAAFLCLTEVICWPGNTAVHQEDLGYEVFLTLNGTCDALDARPLVQIPRCQFLPTVSHHF